LVLIPLCDVDSSLSHFGKVILVSFALSLNCIQKQLEWTNVEIESKVEKYYEQIMRYNYKIKSLLSTQLYIWTTKLLPMSHKS